MPRHYAIVPAAGSGSRFGAEKPKQYLDLLGRPLIFHTLKALTACPDIERVWVVLAPDDPWWPRYDWSELGAKLETVRCGGATRAESVTNGLQAAAMVAADDEAKIADFGLARALAEATWTEPEGVLLGTAKYSAPEQALGKAVDGRSDVYSLVATLYTLLARRSPLELPAWRLLAWPVLLVCSVVVTVWRCSSPALSRATGVSGLCTCRLRHRGRRGCR